MCSTKSKDILNIFVYTFNPMEYFKHFKNNPAVCNGSFTFPDVYILILSFHRGISIDAKWLTVCYIVWRYVVFTSHLSIFWTSLNTYSISHHKCIPRNFYVNIIIALLHNQTNSFGNRAGRRISRICVCDKDIDILQTLLLIRQPHNQLIHLAFVAWLRLLSQNIC